MSELLREIGGRIAAAGPAYFVGGCVRDCLRGDRVKDVDLAVEGSPRALGRILADAYHGHLFWLREEEGVVRVLLPEQEGLQIDISPLRGTLEEDLRARDLTINSMAIPAGAGLEPEAEVIDPAGGRADLTTGIIRFTTPQAPEQDPLRTLRALRFRWRLGFALEPATAERIRACAPLLARTSTERIRDELFQLLSYPRVSAALEECFAFGLARWLLGRLAGAEERDPLLPGSVRALEEILAEVEPAVTAFLETGPTPPRKRRELLLWAAVLEPLSPPLDPAAAARHLALSGDERQIIARGVAGAARARELAGHWSAPNRFSYRLFREVRGAEVETVLLAAAVDGWRDPYPVLFEEALQWQFWPAAPLLSGFEVMQLLHLQPGPAVGKAIEEVEEARADGLIRTREEAVTWLRERPRRD